MATIASLVANPIILRRPKFHPPRIAAFSGRASNFDFVDCRRKNTAVTSSTHHRSIPNAIGVQNEIGIGIGKSHGRMGGKWEYPHMRSRPMSFWERFLMVATYIFWGLIAYILVPVRFHIHALGIILLACLVCFQPKKFVVKLQVGFSGKVLDSLGIQLSQIAQVADSYRGTNRGLTYAFNETVILLLQYCDYYSSSQISVVRKFRETQANTLVDDLSLEQRMKNKETLVNVNNLQMPNPNRPDDFQNDGLMVTMIVAATGKSVFPTIRNKHDLENVLHKLRRIISSDDITAIEVLWTPQVFSCSPRTSM